MAVVPILSVEKKSEEISDGGMEDGDITDQLPTAAALAAREPITADAPLWEVIGLHSDAPMFLHCPPNNASSSSEQRNDNLINNAGARDTVQKKGTMFTRGIDIAEPIGYTIPNLTMTPFTVTPGLLQNVTASVGEFVCNAQVKVRVPTCLCVSRHGIFLVFRLCDFLPLISAIHPTCFPSL